MGSSNWEYLSSTYALTLRNKYNSVMDTTMRPIIAVLSHPKIVYALLSE